MEKTLWEIYEFDKVEVKCTFCEYPKGKGFFRNYVVPMYMIDDETVCEDCMKTEVEEVERVPTYNELMEVRNK